MIINYTSISCYMCEHINDYELSLKNIAGYFQCSPNRIRRIIQRETGKGYKEYLTQLRMEYAKLLLRNGSRVNDAFQATGYLNRHTFIKAFKRYAGITPSLYRKNNSGL